ncbi:MAG: DNA-binding protein [Roseivirga sp.]|nr:DNA-binding protein [Roseivirga sp.]
MQLTLSTPDCQQRQVLAYMKEGNAITNMVATKAFHITRLGDVIFRLRKKGHEIKTELVKNKTNHQSHAKYTLIKKSTDEEN